MSILLLFFSFNLVNYKKKKLLANIYFVLILFSCFDGFCPFFNNGSEIQISLIETIKK